MVRENKGLIIIESDGYRVIIDPRSPVEWGLLGRGTNTFDSKVRIARLVDGPQLELVLDVPPASDTNQLT